MQLLRDLAALRACRRGTKTTTCAPPRASSGMPASTLRISSLMPSEKYSLSLSPLMLTNGSTAIDFGSAVGFVATAAAAAASRAARIARSPSPPMASSSARISNSVAAHALRAALAVIPGEHERDEKTDAERDDDETDRLLRPAEALRDDVEHLDQRERRGDVSQRPLHQLAVAQALQNVAHAGASPVMSDMFSPRRLRGIVTQPLGAQVRAVTLCGTPKIHQNPPRRDWLIFPWKRASNRKRSNRNGTRSGRPTACSRRKATARRTASCCRRRT